MTKKRFDLDSQDSQLTPLEFFALLSIVSAFIFVVLAVGG